MPFSDFVENCAEIMGLLILFKTFSTFRMIDKSYEKKPLV